MSAAKEKNHAFLEAVFGGALPLVLLGPSIALYFIGAPLVLLMALSGARTGSFSPLWIVGTGIGLFSCVALARCQRREWLGTVSGYIWFGIAIGYAAFLLPAIGTLLRGQSIPWHKLLGYQGFIMGGGPALYVPIIAIWMILRERRYRRSQGVVTS